MAAVMFGVDHFCTPCAMCFEQHIIITERCQLVDVAASVEVLPTLSKSMCFKTDYRITSSSD